MNEPNIALYVKDDVLYFTKKLPSESEPHEMLEIGVAEVMSDEFDEAARKLGGTVFGILALWRKDISGKWGVQFRKEDAESEDYSIAQRLISKSVADKTSIHVCLIDAPLRQESLKSEDANKFF